MKKLNSILTESIFMLIEANLEMTKKNFGHKVLARALDATHDNHPLIKKSPDHATLTDNLLQHFERHDPTSNKKYTQHIARIYGNGGINRLEDVSSRMNPALSRYDELSKKKQLKPEHRDIGKVKSLSELEDINDHYVDTKSGKEEAKDHHEEMKKQATITEHPEFTHIIPHTEAASKHFGKGTRWCTAADKHCMFDYYNRQGPLQIYIPKKPNYPGEKYQFHWSADQMMNEKDLDVRDIASRHPAIGEHVRQYSQGVKDATNNLEKALAHPESAASLRFFYKNRNKKRFNEDQLDGIYKRNKDSAEMYQLSDILNHYPDDSDRPYKHTQDLLDDSKKLIFSDSDDEYDDPDDVEPAKAFEYAGMMVGSIGHPSALDALADEQDPNINDYISSFNFLKPETISKMLDLAKNKETYTNTVDFPHGGGEGSRYRTLRNLVMHPNATSEHIDSIAALDKSTIEDVVDSDLHHTVNDEALHAMLKHIPDNENLKDAIKARKNG